MDDLERRLREDAEAIRVEVPPRLTARIVSSVRGVRGLPPARREFGWPLWLAASLTGAVAAGVAIVSVNRGSMDIPEPPAAEAVVDSVPDYILEFDRQLPLRAKTADLTAPLEEELKNLRSDLERARENVEQDLDFTF
jgi:hypothetical protein